MIDPTRTAYTPLPGLTSPSKKKHMRYHPRLGDKEPETAMTARVRSFCQIPAGSLVAICRILLPYSTQSFEKYEDTVMHEQQLQSTPKRMYGILISIQFICWAMECL